MSIQRPDDLDYNEELFDRLSSVPKNVLVRFYNLYCGELDNRPVEKSAHSKRELRQIVAAKFPEHLEAFLNDYEQLRDESLRTDPAVEYLSKHFDIQSAELNINNRYELLILLYEKNIDQALNELVIRSKMQTYSASRGYIYDEAISLDRIDEDLQKFHELWNHGPEKDISPVRVKKEFQTDNIIVLKILQEVNKQSPQTFRFREEERDEIPTVPELTTVSYHQLKTVRIQFEIGDDETAIVFSESFTRWRQLLPELFEVLTGEDDFLKEIERVQSDVAADIEDNMVDAIESGEDPVETARDSISARQDEVEDEVENMDIPRSRKENLKTRINSIEISGSEISGDQSIETQEFRLIAGLEGLFSSVDIEEGFKDLIEKADSEKQSFVLTVDDRPVELNNGEWDKLGPGQLRDLDRRALEIFFDSEVEI